MAKYKLLLSYDGTNYVGWQVQPTGLSIQECLEKALKLLVKERVRITGSGRTDSGVHAKGQVAHFETRAPVDIEGLKKSLNGVLPVDIRIKELCEAPTSFHARFSATRKIYHYHFWFGQTIDPFYRLYRAHLKEGLNLPMLKEATRQFIGTRDFASYANVGTPVSSTVRTIHRLELIEQEGGARLEFEGDGFLYKMVRNITGSLIEVAQGKRKVEDIAQMLDAKNRRALGKSAPARGLFLEKVIY